MNTQFTVVCVVLFCGLFSPIYGKLSHPGKEKSHHGGAVHHEVHAEGAHPNRHTLNVTIPHKIPDLLDIASEALAYVDANLKKQIQEGIVEYPSLEIMLAHVKTVKSKYNPLSTLNSG